MEPTTPMTTLLLHLSIYFGFTLHAILQRVSWAYVFPWQFRNLSLRIIGSGGFHERDDMVKKIGVVIFNDEYFSHEGLAALKWASNLDAEAQLGFILLVREVVEQSQPTGKIVLSSPHHMLNFLTCVPFFCVSFFNLNFALNSSLYNFSYWTWLIYTLLPTRRYSMCRAWSLI